MILTCPECHARYLVSSQALLPKGRTVRCAKCRHTWQEQAPVDMMSGGDAAETENSLKTDQTPDSALAGVDAGGDEADAFALRRAQRKKRPRPLPKGSNLPALQGHKYGRSLWGWYSLGAFVVIFISSFLIFQSRISQFWPPSQKLYSSLGMDDNSGSSGQGKKQKPAEVSIQDLFEIKDTTPSKVIINGVVTLKVAGNIVNLTPRTLSAPPLRIFLKNSQGKTIRKWTFKPSAATIAPKGKVVFSTSLPNPPKEAASISVIFAVNKQ